MSQDIQWSDDLRSDNPIIDSQHKWLFSLARRLFASNIPARNYEEISDIVLQLYQYMEFHFEREEHLAKDSLYPQYDAQVRAHRSFIAKMNDMMTSCTTLEELRPRLYEIFYDWFKQHILTLDKDLALFIKNKRQDD
jgi:hemerythrin